MTVVPRSGLGAQTSTATGVADGHREVLLDAERRYPCTSRSTTRSTATTSTVAFGVDRHRDAGLGGPRCCPSCFILTRSPRRCRPRDWMPETWRGWSTGQRRCWRGSNRSGRIPRRAGLVTAPPHPDGPKLPSPSRPRGCPGCCQARVALHGVDGQLGGPVIPATLHISRQARRSAASVPRLTWRQAVSHELLVSCLTQVHVDRHAGIGSGAAQHRRLQSFLLHCGRSDGRRPEGQPRLAPHRDVQGPVRSLAGRIHRGRWNASLPTSGGSSACDDVLQRHVQRCRHGRGILGRFCRQQVPPGRAAIKAVASRPVLASGCNAPFVHRSSAPLINVSQVLKCLGQAGHGALVLVGELTEQGAEGAAAAPRAGARPGSPRRLSTVSDPA